MSKIEEMGGEHLSSLHSSEKTKQSRNNEPIQGKPLRSRERFVVRRMKGNVSRGLVTKKVLTLPEAKRVKQEFEGEDGMLASIRKITT